MTSITIPGGEGDPQNIVPCFGKLPQVREFNAFGFREICRVRTSTIDGSPDRLRWTMWTVRVSKRTVCHAYGGRSFTTAYGSRQEGRAEYPPILDVSPEPTMLRQELNTHLKIRDLGTVEEKTIGLNMPRYD